MPRGRRVIVCGARVRFGEVTMCKTHLDKTLHPAPFLSSSARSLSARGSACGWHVSRTPPLGTPTRLYIPLLPAWHGLAVGELPTVKDVPVPSLMAARSPSKDPSPVRRRGIPLLLPHGIRQPPLAPGVLGAEKALHPLCVQARHPALQRALRGRARRLRRALRGRATEQRQRADELVVPLLGPAAQEFDLLPFVGRLDTEPTAIPAHPHPPLKRHPAAASNGAAGREACHRRSFAASLV